MDHTDADCVVGNDDLVTFGSAWPPHDHQASMHGLDIQISPADVSTSHVPNSTMSDPGKPRQLTEKEWEDLKDVLHAHYIRESKTLENVREIMRVEQGIILTRRQLTKRFAKWQFKKNVKQVETETFLQNAESASIDVDFCLDGVRITTAKRERWKKRARTKPPHDGLSSSSTNQLPSLRDVEGPVEAESTRFSRAEAVIGVPIDESARQLSHPPSTASSQTLRNTISSKLSSSTVSPDTIELVDSDERPIDEETASQILFPDTAWPVPPVSGDAKTLLPYRLFAALSIAPPNDTIPFNQSLDDTERVVEVSETISNEQLMDLGHGGRNTSLDRTRLIIHKSSSKKRTASSAFKFPDVDAIFSSGEILFATPLILEPDPFPRHEENRFEATLISKHHDLLRLEMEQCMEKIKMYEMASLEHTEAGTVLIDRFAVANFTLGHYDEAERQFSRILPIMVQRHGANSRCVISLKRDLAEALLHLARYLEANGLAQEVYTSALSIDTPGGVLTQKSIQVLAQSYGNLHELAKEEELLRQLVQILLEFSGPRHGDTLAAIRSLCDSITDAQRHSESEELLRIALELGQSAQGLSDKRKCLIHRKLATVLYKQGSYAESEALYRKTVKLSERLLGSEHPDTLRCRFWLCKVLRARGSLEESRTLHLQTVEKQIETRGEFRGSTIESMAALSVLLAEMEMMEDAEVWMERALRCSQQNGGIESTRATRFWEDMGGVHEGKGKQPLRSVFDLYEEMAGEIASLVGPGSRSIEEMFKWNDRVRLSPSMKMRRGYA